MTAAAEMEQSDRERGRILPRAPGLLPGRPGPLHTGVSSTGETPLLPRQRVPRPGASRMQPGKRSPRGREQRVGGTPLRGPPPPESDPGRQPRVSRNTKPGVGRPLCSRPAPADARPRWGSRADGSEEVGDPGPAAAPGQQVGRARPPAPVCTAPLPRGAPRAKLG